MKKRFFIKHKVFITLCLTLLILLVTTLILIPKNKPNNPVPEPTSIPSKTVKPRPTASPTLRPNGKYVALTFDDGPVNGTSKKIMATLKKKNAVATFFMLGYRVKESPSDVLFAFQNGNEIGIHSYDHKNYANLKNNAIQSQQKRTSDAIKKITGKAPVLTRPPYGAWSARISKAINMPIIMWSLDPQDWYYRNKKTNIKNVTQRVKPGDIVLMHDLYKTTGQSLETIIDNLRKKGYEFLTVSQLIEHYGKQALKKNYAYYKKDYKVKAY